MYDVTRRVHDAILLLHKKRRTVHDESHSSPHLKVSHRARAPPSSPLEALVARQAGRGHPAVGHQQRRGEHEARPQESRRRQRQGVT